jgi:hypothetical protein
VRKGKKGTSLEDLLGRMVTVTFLEGGHKAAGRLSLGCSRNVFWIELYEEIPRNEVPQRILLSRDELDLSPDGTGLCVRAARTMDTSSMLISDI